MGGAVTKTDIINAIAAADATVTKKDAAQLVETVLETMKEVLVHEGELKISGFGKFSVRTKVARLGRNPYTGEPTTISARRVLTFKPSNVLKDALNPARTDG